MGYPDVAWGINELRDTFYGGMQEFLSSGSFTVPDNVYKIYVTACAAGASGGCITSRDNYYTRGGNAGQFIYRKPFLVTPKQTISITIGNGGKPVISGNEGMYLAKPGGNTIIGDLITLKGGTVDLYNNNGNALAGITNVSELRNSNGDAYDYITTLVNCGENSSVNVGGRCGVPYINRNDHLSPIPSGGGASLGKGGNGGNVVSYDGTEVPATNGEKGSGGGGAGYRDGRYSDGNYTYYKPGNGGNGYCLIEW